MATASRRDFMARAAALTASSLIVGTAAGIARAQPEKKLGFALCGLGELSTTQIAPALQDTRYCRLAGVITGSSDKAKAWRAKYGIPERNVYSYDTMHRLADNADIDVVYVVTPNALHAEHTIAAAKAGKHVFCEKPMEVSVERCQQMIDACKTAGRMLGIAYRCQFDSYHRECMRIARSKELGEVRLVEASFGFVIGDPRQWRLRRALAGGGALMDVGIYALQASRYLTGEEPSLVSATATRTDAVKFAEVDESVVWHMKFPSGALANCTTSYNASGLGRVRVDAQRGWFELEPAFNYTGLRGRRSDGKAIEFPPASHFVAEMDDFAQCILEKKATRVPGEEGLRDVRIMMAIYEAARTGRTLTLA
jgi:predicted dehydrogenase